MPRGARWHRIVKQKRGERQAAAAHSDARGEGRLLLVCASCHVICCMKKKGMELQKSRGQKKGEPGDTEQPGRGEVGAGCC